MIGSTAYAAADFEQSGLIEFDMLEVSGTGFGDDFKVDELNRFDRGTLRFVLNACDEAVAYWTPEKSSDVLGTEELAYQLQRITLGLDGVGCGDAATVTNAAPLNQGSPRLRGELSGSWFDPVRDGEGFVFEFGRNVNGATSTLYWFTHRAGKPYWLIGNTGYTVNQNSVEFELLEVSGTGFGNDFNSSDVIVEPWGEISLDFDACDRGTGVWANGLDESGSYDLRRITSALDGAPCLSR